MLPAIDPVTGYLPPGVHDASWQEVSVAFGTNPHRQRLLVGLEHALRNLAQAGCATVLLDGSFVTSKALPNDYDAAWEPAGVDLARLDRVFFDMSFKRAAMKMKYAGEFFPAIADATGTGVLFRDFFQSDRSGVAKGVVRLDLGTLP